MTKKDFSVKSIEEALDQNKTLLVIDLRNNPNIESCLVKILELVDQNYDYVERNSYENERYTQLFECICNDDPLISTYSINTFSKVFKKTEKNTFKSVNENPDLTNNPYFAKISQECEILREENEKLRKKLGKPERKLKNKLENTQDYINLAEKKLKEVNKVLELVDDF